MKIRQYFAKNYKSIWMILGPLKSYFQRASNAPNPIDFLSLKTKLSRIPCGDHPWSDIIPLKKTRDYIQNL